MSENTLSPRFDFHISAENANVFTLSSLRECTLIKGCSGGNNFLILLDPDMRLALTKTDIVNLCDRCHGVGADGFIRIVRTAALPGAKAFCDLLPEAQWFMDAYQADGEVIKTAASALFLTAQMLVDEKLISLAVDESVLLASRGGAYCLTGAGQALWTADMGTAQLVCPEVTVADVVAEGWDSAVTVSSLEGERAALSVAMNYTHKVIALSSLAELETIKSTDSISSRPAAPAEIVYDFILPLGEEVTKTENEEETIHLGRGKVRVISKNAHNNAELNSDSWCTAALALHYWDEDKIDNYLLDVPGGQIGVNVSESQPGQAKILLTGSATIVGEITIN